MRARSAVLSLSGGLAPHGDDLADRHRHRADRQHELASHVRKLAHRSGEAGLGREGVALGVARDHLHLVPAVGDAVAVVVLAVPREAVDAAGGGDVDAADRVARLVDDAEADGSRLAPDRVEEVGAAVDQREVAAEHVDGLSDIADRVADADVLLRRQQLLEPAVHLDALLDLTELHELARELVRIERRQRVLMLELGREQRQEAVEIAGDLRLVPGCGAAGLAGGEWHDLHGSVLQAMMSRPPSLTRRIWMSAIAAASAPPTPGSSLRLEPAPRVGRSSCRPPWSRSSKLRLPLSACSPASWSARTSWRASRCSSSIVSGRSTRTTASIRPSCATSISTSMRPSEAGVSWLWMRSTPFAAEVALCTATWSSGTTAGIARAAGGGAFAWASTLVLFSDCSANSSASPAASFMRAASGSLCCGRAISPAPTCGFGCSSRAASPAATG